MFKQKFTGVPWTTPQTFGGVAITLALYVCVALLSGLLFHIPTKPLSPAGDAALAGRAFVYSLLAEGVFLVIPLYYALRAARQLADGTRSLWQLLGMRRFRVLQAVLLVLLSFMVIVFVNDAYQWLITTLHLSLQVNSEQILRQGKIVPLTTYVMLFMAVFWAPFCEEIFFRSFTFMGLKNGMPLFWAVVLSAFIFAVLHFDPASFPVLFIIGIALALLRWKTASIWPGMILHFMNNGLSTVLVILVLRGFNL